MKESKDKVKGMQESLDKHLEELKQKYDEDVKCSLLFAQGVDPYHLPHTAHKKWFPAQQQQQHSGTKIKHDTNPIQKFLPWFPWSFW